MKVKGIWEVLKKAGRGFIKDKVPKLSASLAYYTVFSLGPMLLVIIFLANLFWGQQAVEGLVVDQLKNLVGRQAALQIQEIIKNASVGSGGTFTVVAGFVTLFIGATTVFSEIQDSINSIWHLRLKKNTGWRKILVTRMLSFSIVVSLGFLLLVSLMINALLEILMDRLKGLFPNATVILVYIANLVVTLLVTTFLFGMIYKVLPDARIRWKDVLAGAVFTAVLFMLTKFGITFYIGSSDIGSTYGAAGSLVVLLLWIYFSAMILYFGAEFTKFYALKFGKEIRANSYTVTVQTLEQESNAKSVQENESDIENLETSELRNNNRE